MTDNFENIRNYLKEVGKLPETNLKGTNDKYYVIELVRRGKDNPDLPAANVHFKNYYVTCLGDFDRYKDDLKNICTSQNLRAYISVNYKSFKQVMLNTLAEYAKRVAAGDYKKPYAIYESCSGKFVDSGDGKWVIDIDREPWMSGDEFKRYLDLCREAINSCRSEHKVNGSNIIWENPSRSGYHFVTVGFKKNHTATDPEDDWIVQSMEVRRRVIEEHGKSELFSEGPLQMIHENHITLLYENLSNS